MKAYKNDKGEVRLFRPDMNMARLNRSGARFMLPTFDGEELVECIKELLRIEQRWVPPKRGWSLYLRPTFISTLSSLGVAPTTEAMLYVIMSPVGAYYKSGFNPVKLQATTKYVRAWKGGVGDCKVGGNYAPGMLPQKEAADDGYAQNLWLADDDHKVTEVGTMNLFCFWRNEQGEDELITCPLDGTILPGVTRDSILQLGRESNAYKVSERTYTMKELIKALNEQRVYEVFGSGTAAIVSPVNAILYEGTEYAVPIDRDDPDAKVGKLALGFMNTLLDIQYGERPHKWSMTV
jgi:branched-chain amino acid aminotransferase